MRASISVAIAGLVWFTTHVSAQPNKELYELQERCGKRAEEFFRREYGPASGKDGQMFNYENHYSSRLNKCFFLLIFVSFEKGKLDSTTSMLLSDLNDKKEYGEFHAGPTVTRPDGTPLGVESTPLACVVRGKICRSESEWRQLVKPFME